MRCAYCLEEMKRGAFDRSLYHYLSIGQRYRCYYGSAYHLQLLRVDTFVFLAKTYAVLPKAAQFGLYGEDGEFLKMSSLYLV
jgi:hypothetical protein